MGADVADARDGPQLRGRAGRQGDPGSSQFFASLEDNLMRLFGSERIASLMDRMGLKEGEVIQHSMITKSIERAQKKVEENNFGIRKRDLAIVEGIGDIAREVGYPRFVYFHLTKNATEKNLATVEALVDAGIGTQVSLSIPLRRDALA